MVDGALHVVSGDAGSRRGPEAVACVSNTIFALDAAGACTEWTASMSGDGRYEQAPARCGFETVGGAEVFVASVHGREARLAVDGDALSSGPLAEGSRPMADYAAARAALAAR